MNFVWGGFRPVYDPFQTDVGTLCVLSRVRDIFELINSSCDETTSPTAMGHHVTASPVA